MVPAGCAKTETGGEGAPAPNEPTAPTPAASLPSPIDSGQHSRYPVKRDTALAVRDARAYANLEAKLRGIRPRDRWRRLDFQRRMAVAVLLAPGGGGESLTIERVDAQHGRLLIHALHTLPGHDCVVAAVITNLFAVAEVARAAGEPRLVLRTRTRDC